MGSLIDYLEDKGELLEEFNETLIAPEKEAENCLKKFILPFDPIKHRNLLAKNFEDEDPQLDLENM